ncbi:MAG: hypothetical protein KIG65_02430 [Eubacteriales bacterium]|nr:hypothetical protein [Eubacteriales bacterium]
MKRIRIMALLMCIIALCSCGKEIKNYRVHNDLVISFTEALGDRKLISENLEKTEDGRVITKAEYTYKSEQPSEDKENYLYYLLNNYDAAFLGEDVAAIASENFDCSIMVEVTNDDETFTISITRPNMVDPEK